MPSSVNKTALKKFFEFHLGRLPEPYTQLDSSRLTVIYFCVVGLDLLGELDSMDEVGKRVIIDYIYAQQLNDTHTSHGHRGFLGTYQGQPFGSCLCNLMQCIDIQDNCHSPTDQSQAPRCILNGHLAMAYTALAVLKSLGDDCSRVDKSALIREMSSLQQSDGCFSASHDGSECDMRFLYCACAISYMIDDWSGVDKDRAVEYIKSCITYEGGIALVPNSEAHGGSCYCATASLVLMDRLDSIGEKNQANLIQYCLYRQGKEGYEGRTSKVPDTCYSFWVGGSLDLLRCIDETDIESTKKFIIGDCHSEINGGFSKHPDVPPDILHTFYSTCWLSLVGLEGVRKLDTKLGICKSDSVAQPSKR